MWYTKIFYQNLMFRHSCSHCHYCNTERPSDLTLADFWGWEKVDPEINKDDKGISLILVNWEKGRKLWEAVQHDMDTIPVQLEECMQTRMQFPTPANKSRHRFEADYVSKGFEYVFNKDYDKENLLIRILQNGNRIIKKLVCIIKK